MRLTRLLLGLALTAGFLGVPLAAPALGCSCVPVTGESLDDSSAAVVATVIDRQGDWYTLEVTQDLLGNVADTIDVESPGQDSAGCGFTWEVGDEVTTLVHVAEGQGVVGLCSITDEATLAAAVMDAERAEGPHPQLALEGAPATTTIGRLLLQVTVIGLGLFIGWRVLRWRSARSEDGS